MGSVESLYRLLLKEAAILSRREFMEGASVESPLLLDKRRGSSPESGKAQAYPGVGFAAVGSGIPVTDLRFGAMAGATRAGA